MGRIRSIKQQITYAVRQSHTKGVSKRYEKLNNPKWQERGQSWSYQTLENRLETAKNFSKFMCENYSEIRRADEITPEHFNAYLRSGAALGWSKATLDARASDCRAIARELDTTYRIIHAVLPNYKIDIKPPKVETQTFVRTNKGIEADDLKKLETSCNDTLYKAITLAHTFGLRAEGLATIKGGNVYRAEDGNIHCIITEKGGRERDIKALNEELGENALAISKAVEKEERILPVKADSLSRALTRQMERTGLKEKYPKVSMHAIRKTFAQECYDNYRKSHTKYETIRYVNEQLGHGADRDVALLSKYVENIH